MGWVTRPYRYRFLPVLIQYLVYRQLISNRHGSQYHTGTGNRSMNRILRQRQKRSQKRSHLKRPKNKTTQHSLSTGYCFSSRVYTRWGTHRYARAGIKTLYYGSMILFVHILFFVHSFGMCGAHHIRSSVSSIQYTIRDVSRHKVWSCC